MALEEGTVKKHFEKLAGVWAGQIEQDSGTLDCQLSNANGNSIAFRWEKRAPEEIWYSLGSGGKWLYENWDEHLEREQPEVILEYSKILATRWLEHPVRLRRTFWLWGRIEPQFFSTSGWENVRRI